MRKYFGVLAALLLMVAPLAAQDTQRVPLAIAWDMDGEAADDDQVVASADLDDSNTYTLAAQPDTCRVVNITVTDANSSISAGTITVTGTDCWGDAQTCLFTFAAGGSGVKALTYGTGSGLTCAFASVTSVITSALTGEDAGPGTDLVKVGYTANSAYTYPIYGIKKVAGGKRYVDPFAFGTGRDTVTVNGTAVASFHTSTNGGAFVNIAVGDLIYLVTNGQQFERRVVTVTDIDNIVIDVALPTLVPALATTDEVKFLYKKFFKLVDANEAWVPITNKDAGFFVVDVDANANTGGVTSSIECAVFNAFTSAEYDPNVQVDTDNIASAATGTNTTSIDFALAPYTHCRAGLKFGTGDDADAAAEDLNLFLMIRRRN